MATGPTYVLGETGEAFPDAPVDIDSSTADAGDIVALLVTLGLANDTA